MLATLDLVKDPVTTKQAAELLDVSLSAVQKARDEGRKVAWTPSLGYDVGGREACLMEALQKNRLPAAYVAALLPNREIHPKIAALLQDFGK